jgi:hypothetical protein
MFYAITNIVESGVKTPIKLVTMFYVIPAMLVIA